MKTNKSTATILAAAAALLGASTLGCTADTDDTEVDESIGSVEQPLLTIGQQGWAWVLQNGAVGGSNVFFSGGVSASWNATGQYRVSFTGGTVINPHAQVVAYGASNAHCKLGEGDGLHSWRVFCFNAAGSWTDSAFTIVMDDRSGTSTIGRGAYLRSSAIGVVTRSWNSDGGMNTVSWSDANQEYTVTMPGMPTHNASVHVTADGGDYDRCKVRSWSTGSVKVKCYDASGGTVQSQFYVSYNEDTQHGQRVGGHAWVNSGTPSSFFSAAVSSSACDPPAAFTATASGLDRYVTLPDPWLPPTSWTDFVPMVTGYGNNANYCKVTGWWDDSGFNAGVRCFDASGTQIDTASTAFTLTFTANYYAAPC